MISSFFGKFSFLGKRAKIFLWHHQSTYARAVKFLWSRFLVFRTFDFLETEVFFGKLMEIFRTPQFHLCLRIQIFVVTFGQASTRSKYFRTQSTAMELVSYSYVRADKFLGRIWIFWASANLIGGRGYHLNPMRYTVFSRKHCKIPNFVLKTM
jgi:hypothetical protein